MAIRKIRKEGACTTIPHLSRKFPWAPHVLFAQAVGYVAPQQKYTYFDSGIVAPTDDNVIVHGNSSHQVSMPSRGPVPMPVSMFDGGTTVAIPTDTASRSWSNSGWMNTPGTPTRKTHFLQRQCYIRIRNTAAATSRTPFSAR